MAQNRPQALPVIPDNIPTELRNIERWLIWRYTLANRTWKKIPHRAAAPDERAAINDATSWSSFKTALAAYKRKAADGIGLVLIGEGLIAIDIDNAISADNQHQLVTDLLAWNTYTEMSPSGRGVRAFGYAKLPKASLSRRLDETLDGYDKPVGVELHNSAHYVTVTGRCLNSCAVVDIQPQVLAWWTSLEQQQPSHTNTSNTGGEKKKKNSYSALDQAALDNLAAWVPHFFPKARKYQDGYRISSTDLGRDLEEDLQILPSGVMDFGEERGLTPLGVLIKVLGMHRRDAARELGRLLGISTRKAEQASRKQEVAQDEELELEQEEPAKFDFVSGADISPENVRWLCPSWLAAGEFTLLAGESGTAKTHIAVAFAALITAGGLWPDGSVVEPGKVLYVSGEDALQHTLVPRFLASDGVRSHIRFYRAHRGSLVLPDNLDDLREAILAFNEPGSEVKLLVLDPPSAFMRGDSNDMVMVRSTLEPIMAMCRELGCAALGIAHFTKSKVGDPVNFISGSGAWYHAPRLILAVAQDEHKQRVIGELKQSLGPEHPFCRCYELESVDIRGDGGDSINTSRIVWGGQYAGSIHHVLGEQRDRGVSKTRKGPGEVAADLMVSLLTNGARRGKAVLKRCKEAGVSQATAYRAHIALGIVAFVLPQFGKDVWWRLPAHPEHEDPEYCMDEDADGTAEVPIAGVLTDWKARDR